MIDLRLQHAATFAMLELPDAKSLLKLAGISEDAEEIDATAVVLALERHKAFLKKTRVDALVRAESEVAQIGGGLPANAAEEGEGSRAAVDTVQLQAAVEGAMARLEQRMQVFIQEEMRKAIIIITKLEVPHEAPPPPQFTSQQFRCESSLVRVHAALPPPPPSPLFNAVRSICGSHAPSGGRAITDVGGPLARPMRIC